MNVFSSVSEYTNTKPTVVTIGTFDGVHIGHKEILKQLTSTAKKEKLVSVILTFFPHPRMVLQKETEIKLINTIDERVALLEKTGLDTLIIHPFTSEFSRLSALEFIRDILVTKLNLKKIIIGYDHRFGRNRDATIEDLIAFGKTYDFKVVIIEAQQLEEVSVSSTKIRKALESGNIDIANKYLGYQYSLSGTITSGKGIGKTLNFPTANLHIDETYKLIPKKGVYIVSSKISGKKIYGLTNIGTNPTVGGTQQTIETYFLDFNENLYDKMLQLEFIIRIRDEEVFKDIESLKSAIKKDEIFAREFVSSL